MFDKPAIHIANEATAPAPEPAVQQKRPRGRPRSNPNDPKWLNAPTPVARPATAKRGIPKDEDDFKPTEYFKKRAGERAPAQPRKSKRARTLVYESLDQEVIMANAFPDPEPADNARAQVTQEPTPPPSGNPSEAPTPRDSIVVPAENPSGHHHNDIINNNTNSNNARLGLGGLLTPPESSSDDDDKKNGRMGPPLPRRQGIPTPSRSPSPSPPKPARVPSSVPACPVPARPAPVPAAPVPARDPGSVLARPAPVPEAAPVPARIQAPAPPAPPPAPAVPAPVPPLVAPAAPALARLQVPAPDGLDFINPIDPLGVGPGPADFPFDVDAAMALYLDPFELPPAYVNQWDAWRQPGPFNAWVQPERNFFREAMAAHPRGGMCAACMARYGNGFDVLEELFPAFGQQPCCWAWPGNQFMGAQ